MSEAEQISSQQNQDLDTIAQENLTRQGLPPTKDAFSGTKHKVKVNNQEIEVPYETLIADYRINAAAQQKFQEAAKIRREVDDFVASLKSGDLRKIKELGVPAEKIREFAEAELLDYIQYENLPEADKKRLSAEKERDDYKKRFEEAELAAQQQYYQEVERKVTQDLDQEIASAIKDLIVEEGLDPKKPVEPWFIKHVIDAMLAPLESSDQNEGERISAKKATQHAWKGMQNSVSSYLNSIPVGKALSILSPELRSAIRKADVGDAMTSFQEKIRSKQSLGPSNVGKKKDTKVSTDEFFKKLENRLGR
jgi:hypothetical protein